MCAVAWNFDRLGPNTPADGDAVRGNFIRESKSAAAIFVRELLQNTLDARVPDADGRKKPARVTLDFITPDVDFNKKLCGEIIPFIRSVASDREKLFHCRSFSAAAQIQPRGRREKQVRSQKHDIGRSKTEKNHCGNSGDFSRRSRIA